MLDNRLCTYQGVYQDGSESITVYFFRPGFVTDEELEKEYKLYGLKPAPGWGLAKVNANDTTLAKLHPNATCWKEDGRWRYVTFDYWNVGRRVEGGWEGDWWFAGIEE